jgi:triphosphoribosyl-dephospho-CoA synthase
MNRQLSIGQCATLACLLEVTAPKPGNVHRGANFDDVTFEDFVASAVAIAPAMEKAAELGVGSTVLAAVQSTRDLVNTNTNLGTILLIAPLAAVPSDEKLDAGVRVVLENLTPSDSDLVYQAIRIASPGGMGEVDSMDIAEAAPSNLLEAMRLAADRDLVARQYVDGFSQVLTRVVPWLSDGIRSGWGLTATIVHTHVRLMSEHPDSLIARKCGAEVARKSADLAGSVLEEGQPGEDNYHRALADLDFWLRSDGHRRNPGTTADLIAAGLFAALRDEIIKPPIRRLPL